MLCHILKVYKNSIAFSIEPDAPVHVLSFLFTSFGRRLQGTIGWHLLVILAGITGDGSNIIIDPHHRNSYEKAVSKSFASQSHNPSVH